MTHLSYFLIFYFATAIIFSGISLYGLWNDNRAYFSAHSVMFTLYIGLGWPILLLILIVSGYMYLLYKMCTREFANNEDFNGTFENVDTRETGTETFEEVVKDIESALETKLASPSERPPGPLH